MRVAPLREGSVRILFSPAGPPVRWSVGIELHPCPGRYIIESLGWHPPRVRVHIESVFEEVHTCPPLDTLTPRVRGVDFMRRRDDARASVDELERRLVLVVGEPGVALKLTGDGPQAVGEQARPRRATACVPLVMRAAAPFGDVGFQRREQTVEAVERRPRAGEGDGRGCPSVRGRPMAYRCPCAPLAKARVRADAALRKLTPL